MNVNRHRYVTSAGVSILGRCPKYHGVVFITETGRGSYTQFTEQVNASGDDLLQFERGAVALTVGEKTAVGVCTLVISILALVQCSTVIQRVTIRYFTCWVKYHSACTLTRQCTTPGESIGHVMALAELRRGRPFDIVVPLADAIHLQSETACNVGEFGRGVC